MRKGSKLRRWLLRAVAVAVSVLVPLGALELASRVMQLGNAGTPYVREDPDTIYSNMPGRRGRMESPFEFRKRFAINSKGLRSPEIDYTRRAEWRVLCMGDSFTFGVGADDDETWPAVLSELLSHRESTSVELLNAGVQGWGLAEYLIWFDREGQRYGPDWVVVAVHASDWRNALRGLISVEEDGRLRKNRIEHTDVARLKAIAERIPFYDALMSYSVFAAFLKHAVASSLRGGTTQTLDSARDVDPQERFRSVWPVNRAILLQLEKSVQAIGGRLALVFVPLFETVVGEADEENQGPLFRDHLAAHAVERSIPLVDMTQIFAAEIERGDATIGDLYHLRDGHCTPRGYAAMASAVAPLIR